MSYLAPTYSLVDVLDRGQLSKVGAFVDLNDYRPTIAKQIPARSVDLATVFIGFHHCPLELRDEFITGIRDVLRPGGALVVRDHNVYDERMWRMVALAHDVFNMGTRETWDYNARDVARDAHATRVPDGRTSAASGRGSDAQHPDALR
jgi:SAM-dependent methyltransferase